MAGVWSFSNSARLNIAPVAKAGGEGAVSAFPATLAFMEAFADYMMAAASVPAEITPIRRKKRPADLSRARSKAARDMVVSFFVRLWFWCVAPGGAGAVLLDQGRGEPAGLFELNGA
jgi:hypothetical protein